MSEPLQWNKRRIVGLGLLTLAAAILVVVGVKVWREQLLEDLRWRAAQRSELQRTMIAEKLRQYAYLPFVISQQAMVVDILAKSRQDPGSEVLSRRLAGYQEASKADVIYVMNAAGKTIAASNFESPDSFVGKSYAFRPYYKQAMNGQRGEFYAIGSTTGQPGYFFAEAVRSDGGSRLGVVAVKVDLRDIERAWRDSGETMFVTNRDGVIVLASNDMLRYRTTRPLSSETQAAIAEQRQFAGRALAPAPFELGGGNGTVSFAGRNYLETALEVGRRGWTLHRLTPLDELSARMNLAYAIGFGAVMLVVAAMQLRQVRQVRRNLAKSEQDAAEQRELNRRLQTEMAERRAAERKLLQAERDLAQKDKLALLGRMSASVTHEISQPLSAMKTHISGARIDLAQGGAPDDAEFARLDALVDRMDRIARQMKQFAAKSDPEIATVEVDDIIEGALLVTKPTLDQEGIQLEVDTPDGSVTVRGVKERLEQVLVNLLTNAAHALKHQHDKHIRIVVEDLADTARLRVQDNGPGIDESIRGRIFEPFHSTKGSGEGIGLGLAISANIVTEHGGRIETRVLSERGGTEFQVDLPKSRVMTDA